MCDQRAPPRRKRQKSVAAPQPSVVEEANEGGSPGDLMRILAEEAERERERSNRERTVAWQEEGLAARIEQVKEERTSEG